MKLGEKIKHRYGDYYVYGTFLNKEKFRGENIIWMKIHHFETDERGQNTGWGVGLKWDVLGDYQINKIEKGW